MSVEDRSRELGLELPEAVAPAFSYVSVVTQGGYGLGQRADPARRRRVLMTGKVGAEISLEQARVRRSCLRAAGDEPIEGSAR